MMSATRVTTIVRPVIAPIMAAPATTAIEKRIASSKLMWSMYFAETTLASDIIEPTDRSIPPLMITIDCAHAAKQSGSASITSDCTSNGPHFTVVCERQKMTRTSSST